MLGLARYAPHMFPPPWQCFRQDAPGHLPSLAHHDHDRQPTQDATADGKRRTTQDRCRIEPFLDQGGACGAAGPASAPGSASGRPARRKPGHSRKESGSRWLTRHAGRYRVQPSSPRPIFPVAAAASMPPGAVAARGLPPATHRDPAPARRGRTSGRARWVTDGQGDRHGSPRPGESSLAQPAYVEPGAGQRRSRREMKGRGMAGPSRENALDHVVVVLFENPVAGQCAGPPVRDGGWCQPPRTRAPRPDPDVRQPWPQNK